MVAKRSRRQPAAHLAWLVLLGLGASLQACDRDGGSESIEAAGPSAGAESSAEAAAAPAFAGTAACAGCHAEQYAAWRGSEHDLAMQQPSPATVLGDFDDAEFSYAGVTTRFFQRDGAYFVSTDGADGEIAEFRVSRTFGVDPLQQYLLASDDGRLQALSIAWDTRPRSAGGQRWFDLYPDETIDHLDALHWTGVYQNWNTMCADCHSTGLRKNYDLEADRFATSYDEIDVACEACHGPASAHAADPAVPTPAGARTEHSWVLLPGATIAAREPAARREDWHVGLGAEIDTCAHCHSRRAQLSDTDHAGEPFLDAFRLELLEPGLYHADGQIQDEVYVLGSFLQSRMAEAGVSCSDCHDPHTTALYADGNALCGRCHVPSVYDVPAHHHHEQQSDGAQCVSCHMRAETYMVVDPRRDHSFRVPRPDLSAEIGSPNACNDCHADESTEWAEARIEEWYPDGRWTEPHYGQVFAAAARWAADARQGLLALIADDAKPEIVRATAVRRLAERMAPDDVDVLRRALDSEAPLLVLAAVEAVEQLPPEQRIGLVQRFLSHELESIRTAAARVLLPARGELSARRQSDLDAALDEYRDVQRFNSDRPEGLLNSANLALDLGRFADSEQLFELAIERFPSFPAAYVNLADLYRQTGRPAQAKAILGTGLAASPDAPDLPLALGFALVRSGEPDAALDYFDAAAELAPDVPYYQYVLAIAENDTGDSAAALARLRAAHDRFPGHADTLFALATMLRDAGDYAAAHELATELIAQRPGDANALSLLSELEQQL
jgi:predicted CXXCH cytochrome family protein